MSRLPVIFCCLILCACEGKKHDKAPLSSKTPPAASRPSSRVNTPFATAQQEIETANRDPEIRRRKAALLRDLEEDPANADDPHSPGFPWNRAETDELAALYAARYPQAGLEWILAHKDARIPVTNLIVPFVMQLYKSHPDLGLTLLGRIEDQEVKYEFANSLTWHARGDQVHRMWDYLLDLDHQMEDPSRMENLKRSLIGAQAANDPDGAWEAYQAHMSDPGDEKVFLSIPWGSDDHTPYPAHFFDRILANGHDVTTSVKSAIWHCTSEENIAPIAAWLEQEHPGFEPRSSYEAMADWYRQRRSDETTAQSWLDRAR